MRHGELMSLQMKQIRMSPQPEIFVPASKAKQKKDRRIPISSRLKAILEMRRLVQTGRSSHRMHTCSGTRSGSERGRWVVRGRPLC